MSRRNSLITKAKQESTRRGKFSLVLQEEQRLREFMRFENGEMIYYDVTGRDKSQVSLNNEELQAIRESEENAAANRERKA